MMAQLDLLKKQNTELQQQSGRDQEHLLALEVDNRRLQKQLASQEESIQQVRQPLAGFLCFYSLASCKMIYCCWVIHLFYGNPKFALDLKMELKKRYGYGCVSPLIGDRRSE